MMSHKSSLAGLGRILVTHRRQHDFHVISPISPSVSNAPQNHPIAACSPHRVVPIRVWFSRSKRIGASLGPAEASSRLWFNGQQFMNPRMATAVPDMRLRIG